MSLVDERFSVFRLEIELHGNLRLGILSLKFLNLRGESRTGECFTTLRCNTVDIDVATVISWFTVHADADVKQSVVRLAEEILVIYRELAFLSVHVLYPQVLIVVCHLVGMGIEAAVGGDYTVAVEVVVACGVSSVVTAVGEDTSPCDAAHVCETLVNEVPDISALILRIFPYHVPIFLESAHRVTHGVCILALY